MKLAKGVQGGLDQIVGLRRIRDIGLECSRLATHPLDFPAKRICLRLGSVVVDSDGRSTEGKFQRYGAAYAPTGPRDKGNAVRESQRFGQLWLHSKDYTSCSRAPLRWWKRSARVVWE